MQFVIANEMDAGEIERLKNTLPQFKDSLDVVFYCERKTLKNGDVKK